MSERVEWSRPVRYHDYYEDDVENTGMALKAWWDEMVCAVDSKQRPYIANVMQLRMRDGKVCIVLQGERLEPVHEKMQEGYRQWLLKEVVK